ncbi:RND efflux system, outer membrane lipoprotein, NodT family [uncultured Desulfobacterium sp.]|uniref:RND efflux system, outer membrane lipoprotein, NodT family n=1 Tax=uncultured Desulfobacterium sp. TaxID=201089 RepID=A0A445N1L5_9BACT|nr:RND efflux system, outer membrane lipoprotein, NodT family [uncultured Desulfobacterium sp.]
MRKCVCILLLMVMGCAIGPNYKRPGIDMPAKWRFEEKEARDLADTAWWEQFNDPVLNNLVTTALNENNDLRIATARIEEFFGRYFSTRGDQFPLITGSGTRSRERLSEEGPTPIPAGFDKRYNYYEAFLGASWELDFWGKYRRASEAARAELFQTAEARRTVVLTLVSSVASAYVDILSLDKQMEITRSTVETRKQTWEYFQLRFDKGIIAEVDVSQAEAEYQDAMARLPELELAIARAENALSVLLGRNPGPIPRGLTLEELTLPAVPSGLPSDLLERRPDIRAAEQTLVAANAQIGVAKSLYFPTISLTGALGTVSTDLSDLFTHSSKTWNWAIPVTVPLFTAGRIGGEVKAAEALEQQALYSYFITVQNAFREMDDALIERAKTQEKLQAESKKILALKNYTRLSRMRYDEGLTSYLEVLDAERSLYNAELSYTDTRNQLFRSMTNIYKSMGGGWVETAEAAMTPQPEKKACFVP